MDRNFLVFPQSLRALPYTSASNFLLITHPAAWTLLRALLIPESTQAFESRVRSTQRRMKRRERIKQRKIKWRKKRRLRGNRVPVERLIVAQLVKKLPAFYETCGFITVFTRARHRYLPYATPTGSTPSHPISFRSFSYLRLSLPNGLLPSGFPTKIVCAFLISSCLLHVHPISTSLIWSS
jgi:hypothetical protein